jgi:SNF2 family DNA or RNA helicase
MMHIRLHPKGIALKTVDTRFDPGAITLRQMLHMPVSPLPDRSYLVPTAGAFLVLGAFPSDNNSWEGPALELARKQAAHHDAQIRARLEVNAALDNPMDTLSSYNQLGRLDEHQVAAVAAISAPSLRGMAIFDEQGTGKTIVALAAFEWLRQQEKIECLLVVAPKSVLTSWRTDCQKFLGEIYRIRLVEGASSERRKSILQPHDILLISYDAVVRDIGLLKMVVAAKPQSYMLVVDESYFVKNPETARSRAITELRTFCERAVILCGTPAPNSPIDIVNQINIADGGVAFGNRSISDDAQEAVAQIIDVLDDVIYLRRLKEDVFPDIPVKEIEKVFLDLAPAQQEMYDKAYNDLVLAVKSVDDQEFKRQLTSFLARRVALLQICSNPRSLDSLYVEDPAKLRALDQLLADLIERQDKKVVIWSFFRYSLQSIADRYQRYGLVRIDGSVVGIEERLDAINRFQNDPATRIFLGNAASAGAGITLTAAHHAIYESFSNQAAHYMQSVDRIHRRGQTHDVTYHILIAQGTIEEREFERLLEKERAGRDLLGDRYTEPITRDRFLAELGERHGTIH